MKKPADLEFFVDGMIHCADNATKLSADARRLFSINRQSTAGMLAISSIEEIGKIWLLEIAASIYLQRKQLRITEGEFWKDFNKMWINHRLKQIYASLMDIYLFDVEAIELAKHSLVKGDLFQFRNRFLYVDVDKDKKEWILPKRSDRHKSREFVEAAEDIADEVFREFNPRRRQLILQELRDPKNIDAAVERWDEVREILQQEGFGVEGD